MPWSSAPTAFETSWESRGSHAHLKLSGLRCREVSPDARRCDNQDADEDWETRRPPEMATGARHPRWRYGTRGKETRGSKPPVPRIGSSTAHRRVECHDATAVSGPCFARSGEIYELE